VNDSLANEFPFLIPPPPLSSSQPNPPSAHALKRTNTDEELKVSALPGQVAREDVEMKDAHGVMDCNPPPPRMLNWMGYLSVLPKVVSAADVCAPGALNLAADACCAVT
jgi:hypothetical protein